MKRLLFLILCLCLLCGITAFAEEVPDENSFLLKVQNYSDLEISYFRFDFYRGDELVCSVVSCPNEGEDFCRCLYTVENQDELKDLRIEYAYGISDLSPEEAVLQVMAGNPAEEHPLPSPELSLECGVIYDIILIQVEDSYELLSFRNGRKDWYDWSPATTQPDMEDPVTILLAQLAEFFNKWNTEDYNAMLSLCTADWKAQTVDPAEELMSILDKRKPVTLTPQEVSGTDEDQVRTVTAIVGVSRDGGLWKDYLFRIAMQREEDGFWRVDPRSLQDCELIQEED